MTAKVEYQMVIEPSLAHRALGLRPRNYTYAKSSYEKAVKAVMDFLEQRDSGRFEKTWMMQATVYIESREVSKWQKLDMDAVENAMGRSTTSRPAS